MLSLSRVALQSDATSLLELTAFSHARVVLAQECTQSSAHLLHLHSIHSKAAMQPYCKLRLFGFSALLQVVMPAVAMQAASSTGKSPTSHLNPSTPQRRHPPTPQPSLEPMLLLMHSQATPANPMSPSLLASPQD